VDGELVGRSDAEQCGEQPGDTFGQPDEHDGLYGDEYFRFTLHGNRFGQRDRDGEPAVFCNGGTGQCDQLFESIGVVCGSGDGIAQSDGAMAKQ
jgi:hypothetical protein